MNGTAAVDTTIFRLGRGTGVTSVFRAQVLLELQLAQRRLEESPALPWFLLADRSTITLTLAEERVPLPSDFLRENEEDELRVRVLGEPRETFTALEKAHWDSTPLTVRPDVLGRPKYYTLWGANMILSPAPDRNDYQLEMTYWKKDLTVSLESSNLWLSYAPDYLIAEAGIPLALSIGNDRALKLFESQRRQSSVLLHHQTIARQETNRDPNPED